MVDHHTIFNGDAPWWVKEIRQYVLWFGPTVVVAVVFISMWAGWLPSPITKNSEMIFSIQHTQLPRIEDKFDRAISDMRGEVSKSRWQDESMIRLQLQTCRNTSKTEVQMSKCDDYWKRN